MPFNSTRCFTKPNYTQLLEPYSNYLHIENFAGGGGISATSDL